MDPGLFGVHSRVEISESFCVGSPISREWEESPNFLLSLPINRKAEILFMVEVLVHGFMCGLLLAFTDPKHAY